MYVCMYARIFPLCVKNKERRREREPTGGCGQWLANCLRLAISSVVRAQVFDAWKKDEGQPAGKRRFVTLQQASRAFRTGQSIVLETRLQFSASKGIRGVLLAFLSGGAPTDSY